MTNRPKPSPSAEADFFWRSGDDGTLRILACDACGRLIHPPSPRCPFCGARTVAPRRVSGRGRVYTFTINHHPWRDGLPDRYVVALVELAEDTSIRLVTNIVGIDPDRVEIGMNVVVTFERDGDVWYPLFEPAMT